jgi:hypothetical protein
MTPRTDRIARPPAEVRNGCREGGFRRDGAGSRGGEADAEAAGEFRVGAGGERRRLLVARVDVAQPVLVLAERLDETVDAVAGQSEDGIDAPFEQ